MRKKVKICLLSDGKKGHLIKSEGIIYALSLVTEVEVFTFNISWKIGFLRKALLWSKTLRSLLPKTICLNNFINNDYDFIVSSGGATEWINAKIAKDHKIPNLYIGSLRHLKREAFTYLAIEKYEDYSGFLDVPIVPNAINQEQIHALSEKYYPNKINKVLSILIGGNGSGIKWTAESFQTIFDQFMSLAKANDIKLIFLTSRRTPGFIEALIQSAWQVSPQILKNSIEDDYFKIKADRDHYLATMGIADCIFVSEDSASMISEAISSGKKVYSFKPHGFTGKNHNESLLNKYANSNRLVRLHSIDTFRLDSNFIWRHLPTEWQKELGTTLLNQIMCQNKKHKEPLD